MVIEMENGNGWLHAYLCNKILDYEVMMNETYQSPYSTLLIT